MKTPAARVKRTEKAFTDIPEHSLMLIPTPVIIDAYIKQIPKGRAMDVYNAAMTSPLSIMQPKPAPTTGIFLRIVAEAAWEEHVKGKALKKHYTILEGDR